MLPIHSRLFQVLYFLSSVLEIVLFGGVTFGWASIQVVFKEEGFFSYLCKEQANRTSNVSTAKQSGAATPITCTEQNQMFNLVFNVAVGFLCYAQFPVGHFADVYGPRATQTVGCTLYTAAGLGLAFTTKETSYLLFPIFILICIGGVFIAYAKFRVARVLYVNVRSIIISIFSGSFDSSAFILVVIKLIWESSIRLRDISLFYAALCLILVSSSTIFLTPPYKVLQEEAKRLEPLVTSDDEEQLMKEREMLTKILPETFMKSVCSPQFLLELTYLSICQLRLWYFIGSLDEQITKQFPDTKESVNQYVTYFTFVQFCGILVGPITGVIFDRNSIKCIKRDEAKESLIAQHPAKARVKKMKESILPFVLTNIFCLLISILALAPWRWTLVMAFIFHVITRAFLYSSHASFIAIAFRPERFATLNGLGIFIAGIIGLLEYPIYAITKRYLGSDPFWINIILLILVAVASIFPIYLVYFCKTAEKKIVSSGIYTKGSTVSDSNTQV